MQHGGIRKRRGWWSLRFWDKRIGKDGQPERFQREERLAPVSDQYRSARSVEHLARPFLDEVNTEATPEGDLTIEAFAPVFLKYVESSKKPSTLKFYRDAINNHVIPRAGFVKLRQCDTVQCQRVLDGAASLSHQSCLRIKSTLSAILGYAIRLGFIRGANPARESKAEGKRSTFVPREYSLADIEWLLEHLDEPARTVVAVAAFTGLRESELRGLQWGDYDGQFLHIQRSVWRTKISETKTDASTDSVPVIAPLAKLLDTHRRRDGSSKWIFSGEKMGRSLNLANLARRSILPVAAERWKGWHGFRRGLAGNLFALGTPTEIVAKVLRHASADVTRKHYILLSSEREGAKAMKKLERKVGKIVGQRKRRKSRSPV